MQIEFFANGINRRGFITFILAAAIIIRAISIAVILGTSIVIFSIQVIMSFLCITIGILTLFLKRTLARNASLLRCCIKISSLVWFILGGLCAVLTIFELINASFDQKGQMMGVLFSWIVLFFFGITFFSKFSWVLSAYIRSLYFERSRQNEHMANNYPYGYAPPRISNQPIPGPHFINPSPIVVDQPLYFPPSGNANNQIFGNGVSQYRNQYSAPPQIPPSNY